MSAREWQPGDVAMVTAYNHPTEYRAYYDGRDETWRKCDSPMFCVDKPTSIRHLVVLDLPDGAKAGWPVLVHALQRAREATGFTLTFDGLIEQIEAQTQPPKPEEPTGLGAVVEDAEGGRWVRAGTGIAGADALPWEGVYPNKRNDCRHWNDVPAVRVLSEGMQS